MSLFLSSCETGKEGDGGGSSVSLRMERLDISDAKYLSLMGSSEGRAARSDSDVQEGLFKIDEEGNVSAVVLSCVEEEDGTVIRERTDIRVVPSEIVPLSGVYTLLRQCDFLTLDGEYFDMRRCYEPEDPGAFFEPFHLLVRNSDGKIFYIPLDANRYIWSEHIPVICSDLTSNGDFYLLGGGILSKILVQGENLAIQQISSIALEGTQIWTLDNGTIVVPSYDNFYTFVYPNGGFESLEAQENGSTDYLYLTRINREIKAVRVECRPGQPQDEYVVSLYDYKVGTTVNSNQFSQPYASISSGTDYSEHLGDANYLDWVSKYKAGGPQWITPMYETDHYYLLGTCLVIDKQTNQIRDLSWDESNHIIIPTEYNMYKGLVWRVYGNPYNGYGAEWFDPDTFEYGSVSFDLSAVGPFVESSALADIPEGEMTIAGIRNSDGKQVICVVNIETGEARVSVSDVELPPVVTLIPLN